MPDMTSKEGAVIKAVADLKQAMQAITGSEHPILSMEVPNDVHSLLREHITNKCRVAGSYVANEVTPNTEAFIWAGINIKNESPPAYRERTSVVYQSDVQAGFENDPTRFQYFRGYRVIRVVLENGAYRVTYGIPIRRYLDEPRENVVVNEMPAPDPLVRRQYVVEPPASPRGLRPGDTISVSAVRGPTIADNLVEDEHRRERIRQMDRLARQMSLYNEAVNNAIPEVRRSQASIGEWYVNTARTAMDTAPVPTTDRAILNDAPDVVNPVSTQPDAAR